VRDRRIVVGFKAAIAAQDKLSDNLPRASKDVEIVCGLIGLATVTAFAGLAASTHPAAASAVPSFDFMAITPLDQPPQPPRASVLQHNSVKPPTYPLRAQC
jgi:hypothetical protein